MTQKLKLSSRLTLSLALVACVAGISGCFRSGSVRPETALLEQSAPYLYSDADWADVLHRYVHDGRVNYADLRENAAPLKRYYALLSRTGPALTPDQFPS